LFGSFLTMVLILVDSHIHCWIGKKCTVPRQPELERQYPAN
jgi:hypothetical protein